MTNVFDEIQEKLEADQIEDKEDLINDLIAALKAVQSRAEQGSFATSEEIDADISFHLSTYEGPILTCAWQTYRATLETPAEYCENSALAGSDYCYMHD